MEVVLYPVARHLLHVIQRGGVLRVVVRPEQAELHQVAVPGVEVSVVQRVFQPAVPRRPVPVVDEKADPVLQGPFDVPVGHLRVSLAIVAQHRVTLGEIVQHGPAGVGVPARKVVGAHQVVACRRGLGRRDVESPPCEASRQQWMTGKGDGLTLFGATGPHLDLRGLTASDSCPYPPGEGPPFAGSHHGQRQAGRLTGGQAQRSFRDQRDLTCLRVLSPGVHQACLEDRLAALTDEGLRESGELDLHLCRSAPDGPGTHRHHLHRRVLLQGSLQPEHQDASLPGVDPGEVQVVDARALRPAQRDGQAVQSAPGAAQPAQCDSRLPGGPCGHRHPGRGICVQVQRR